MIVHPHKEKLLAAIQNNKAISDRPLLEEALCAYDSWIDMMRKATGTGKVLVENLVDALNQYKDHIEVELIARRGSDFLKRQKGQLKIDNSIIEEFLPHLIDNRILDNLPTSFALETGSQTSFMSLSFSPTSINELYKPTIIVKEKDQDFTIGKSIFYKFSSDENFSSESTIVGKLFLAVLAVECKVNYDKTMFQECAGTASRLKQGCPVSKYYTFVEYLDMQPEDTRLTSIDNVFLLRKAKRLPFEKRNVYEEIRAQHRDNPIAKDVVWNFIQEVQSFVNSTWYDPEQALERGSFV